MTLQNSIVADDNKNQRWWLVGCLTAVFVLSFVDRNAMRVLVNPIRADLGIGDVEISLLVGIAFAGLYSVACIPMGHLADVVNRRNLLAWAVLLWSSMAVFCGLSTSFLMLALARAGLGIGEAALQPCATSMIRDSFPVERRAKVFAIYSTAPFMGSALALLAGGSLYAVAESGGAQGIPLLGGLRPWQFALVVPGLAGFLIVLMILTLREPKRNQATGVSSFAATFSYIRENWKLYALVVGAPTLWSLGNTGWMAWLAAAVGRQRGLSPADFGPTAGIISLIFASAGAIALGFLIDRFAKRGNTDAVLKISAVVQLVHIIPSLAVFLVPSIPMMWISFALSMFLTGTTAAASMTMLSELTPPKLIGKTVALYNLVQNFLGIAAGPTIFALIASEFFPGDRGIIPAMMISYPISLLLSSVVLVWFMFARRSARLAGHPAYQD